jgi:hypothetical protein
MLPKILFLLAFAVMPAFSTTYLTVDWPSDSVLAYSGTATFLGWALDDQDVISSVTLSIDGGAPIAANIGALRPDVCIALPGRPGCPNVGWNYTLDTTLMANGSHTVMFSASTATGGHAPSVSRQFIVVNPAIPSVRVIDKTPWIGLVNGSNLTYDLSKMPVEPPDVYLDGLLMNEGGDYTYSGTVVTFIITPQTGSLIQVKYRANKF